MGHARRACVLVFALSACGSRPPAVDAGADSQPCAPATPGADPTVQTFVITAFAIDDNTSFTEPHTGFNLDGLCSDSFGANECSYQDFFSELDPDQNCPTVDREASSQLLAYNTCSATPNVGCGVVGEQDPTMTPTACQGCVDNQLPAALQTLEAVAPPGIDVSATLGLQIRSGHSLMLVQLTGLDTVPDDPSVDLTLLLAFDADADCGNNLDGRGSFLIDDRSFVGGDSTQPRWHTTGSLVHGRWRARLPFAGVMFLPVIDIAPPIEFTDMQLRFDVPTACDALLLGNFGGSIEAQTAIDLLRARLSDGAGLVETATGALVDIPRAGVCYVAMPAPPVYGALGLGMGFVAARAQIVGHAAAPGAGGCGSGPAGRDAGAGDAAMDAAVSRD